MVALRNVQEIDGISEEFVGRPADRARNAEELRRPPDATLDDLAVHESRAVIARVRWHWA